MNRGAVAQLKCEPMLRLMEYGMSVGCDEVNVFDMLLRQEGRAHFSQVTSVLAVVVHQLRTRKLVGCGQYLVPMFRIAECLGLDQSKLPESFKSQVDTRHIKTVQRSA